MRHQTTVDRGSRLLMTVTRTGAEADDSMATEAIVDWLLTPLSYQPGKQPVRFRSWAEAKPVEVMRSMAISH